MVQIWAVVKVHSSWRCGVDSFILIKNMQYAFSITENGVTRFVSEDGSIVSEIETNLIETTNCCLYGIAIIQYRKKLPYYHDIELRKKDLKWLFSKGLSIWIHCMKKDPAFTVVPSLLFFATERKRITNNMLDLLDLSKQSRAELHTSISVFMDLVHMSLSKLYNRDYQMACLDNLTYEQRRTLYEMSIPENRVRNLDVVEHINE